MRILVAVVHYWDPEEVVDTALLANPRPRIEAFQQQLLSLQRMGLRQAQLNIQSMTAEQRIASFNTLSTSKSLPMVSIMCLIVLSSLSRIVSDGCF